MANTKSSFFDKMLGRIDRLHADNLQTLVQRMARERSFLETLFNTIEEGVVVVGKGGRILYFNQASTQLLGLTDETAQVHPISRFLPGVDWLKLVTTAKSGKSSVVRHELEIQYPRTRFLRVYAAALEGDSSGSKGVALILHDATEARQSTFDVIESERVQALTLLAASVAHEIGNPLNALNIHLQLMERELKKLQSGSVVTPTRGSSVLTRRKPSPLVRDHQSIEKLESYLKVAKGEISRLDYIVTQFLQAIRPTPLRLQMTALNDVVRATLDLLRPELENRGLVVSEKPAANLPLAMMDASQVKQVLVNLIKNSMQAMTKGGTLALSTGQTGNDIWVTVSDTGGGIPQEKLKRIFEPFFTTKEKGTGLGLIIVQRIMRAHGGRINLESHVGEGTTFRLLFPLHEPERRLLKAPSHD